MPKAYRVTSGCQQTHASRAKPATLAVGRRLRIRTLYHPNVLHHLLLLALRKLSKVCIATKEFHMNMYSWVWGCSSRNLFQLAGATNPHLFVGGLEVGRKSLPAD